MKIIELTFPFETALEGIPTSLVMALGDFDGIHLGHQEVIRRTIAAAKRLQVPAAIMTFTPHPRFVLGQAKYEQNLTPLIEKTETFSKMGVEFIYLIHFTTAFSQISPKMFVDQVLSSLGIQSVVVGFDFTFGHEGKGTPEVLQNLSEGKFSVEIVPPYDLQGEKVSSTSIREYLCEGKMEQVRDLLGHYYRLRGIVVTGEGRGRTIGFPTANIEPLEAYVIPGKGVYAVRCKVQGAIFNGVMNIGSKPTFTDDVKQTLEAHLFDFNASIYGEQMEVEFIHFIRQEHKFSSVDELIKQIHLDAEEAQRILD
jgi:riboflavin kinase/FMN adenylyltransferase